MTRWIAFALVTNVVLVLVLALARATQAATADGDTPEADGGAVAGADADAPSGPALDDSDLAPNGETGAASPDTASPHEDAVGSSDPTSPDSQARRDAEAQDASSPDSQARRDAEALDASSPDSQARRDAGSREAASEPSRAGAPEDAEEHSSSSPASQARQDAEARGASSPDSASPRQDAAGSSDPASPRSASPHEDADLEAFSTGALLANVALTHGVLGGILVTAAWVADVPVDALGVDLAAASSTGLPAVLAGVALGVGLYVVNELVAANLDRAGVEYDEGLRDALGPGSLTGWLVLLVLVLPIIAVFEELLFRAALIGALSAGFGLSAWLLAALSSVAFGVGHGIQGLGGMIVTGTLGFVLAAAFVLTESLLVVVIAHYLINALEFIVHEGLGIDWAGAR